MGTVFAVAFTPDGKALASGGKDGTVRLWEVATGKEQSIFKIPPLRSGSVSAFSVAFAPDGKTLVAGVKKTHAEGRSLRSDVILWEVATGKELRTFQGFFTNRPSVAFASDGKKLALANGGKVTLWEMATGTECASLQKPEGGAVSSLAISPDGKMLAAGGRPNQAGEDSPRDVTLWELATGKVATILREHTGLIESVAFTADGQTLVSGSWDGTVKLWEVSTSKERATLQGHTGRVFSVAFAPDGRTLASGGEDSTVKLWDITKLPRQREEK